MSYLGLSGTCGLIKQKFKPKKYHTRIFDIIKKLKDTRCTIEIYWVPSHVDIKGNEKADQLAKAAAHTAKNQIYPYANTAPLTQSAPNHTQSLSLSMELEDYLNNEANSKRKLKHKSKRKQKKKASLNNSHFYNRKQITHIALSYSDHTFALYFPETNNGIKMDIPNYNSKKHKLQLIMQQLIINFGINTMFTSSRNQTRTYPNKTTHTYCHSYNTKMPASNTKLKTNTLI